MFFLGWGCEGWRGCGGVFFFSEERGGKGVDEALGFLCERMKGSGD